MFRYFHQLPLWAKSQIMTVALVAVISAWAAFNWKVALIVLGGLLLIGLLVGSFFFLLHRMRDRQAAAFGSEINQQNTGIPRSISDPARQARLDDLRRNFNAGVNKFRAVGKNLYQLPWYVIVGEPGAGKTEAIRHSGVGFPPGMQDELQGVGGTINMNWWFTNQAVILDTAGRLMFEEVEPGTTTEWREFLALLKKYRTNCPINGLFLTLPADSLIREDAAEIERKAGRIARQLEVIQQQFDLRFPVFVIITKCDLLNGFREFFDGIDDPGAQNQLIGWSNPDPLDAPFRPELVDAHIETALGRLRRRRLALLQDPAAQAGPQARRLDEVDRLFALPQSLALMAPRLRRYLEMIFTANEWAAKPLFLRGIYFTSSLREGSALDQELAEAIGVPVDSLPEGRAWEREQTYFLRDVFLEKGFREKGLVTRASNTRKLLLRRQAIVFGAGFAAMALLALLSILGQRELQRSVARQGGYWLRAAEGWQKDEWWQPVVVPSEDEGGGKAKPIFAGDQPVGPGERSSTKLLFHSGEDNRIQFQSDLRDLAQAPLSVSWVFRPLASFGVGIDGDRRRAQRVVFEGGVVKPMLDATREQMIAGSAPSPEAEAGALLSLVRVEAAIAKKAPIDADDGEGWNAKFLGPLLAYNVNKAAGDDTRPLANIASWTYSRDGSREAWAPQWLGGGPNLAKNKAIAAGLERLAANARGSIKNQTKRLELLGELADLTKQFRDKESELYAAVTSRQPVEKTDAAVFALTGVRGDLAPPAGTLKDYKLTLDRKLVELGGNPSLFDKAILLRTGYERSARETRAYIEIIKSLLKECEPFAPIVLSARSKSSLRGGKAELAESAVEALNTVRNPLFTGIAEQLRPLLPELEDSLGKAAPNDVTLALWKELDTNFLEDYGDGRRLYAVRWDAYEGADRVAPGRNYAQSQQLVGSEWKPLKEIFDKTAALRVQVNDYRRGLKEKLVSIVGYNLTRIERFHGQQFPEAYLIQLKAKLKPLARYPLVYPPGLDSEALSRSELQSAGLLARQIDADLKSPVLAPLRNPGRDALAAYVQKLAPWQAVTTTLTKNDGSPADCTVSLVAGATQRQLSGSFSVLDIWPAIELRDGTFRHGSRPQGSAVAGRTRSDSPSDLQLGRFPVDAPFHFHFYRTATDQRIDVDLPCGDNYTAVRLINELFGSARQEGNGLWTAPVKADGQRAIWVKIQFPKPLPTVREWPTKFSLELGD